MKETFYNFFHFLKKIFPLDIIILFIGAIMMFPLALNNAYYMNQEQAGSMPCPLWLTFTFASISIIAVIYLIIKNIIKNKTKFLMVTFIILLSLITINIFTLFLQDETIISHVLVKSSQFPNKGSYVDVTTTLSLGAKFTFSFLFALMLLYIGFGLFILPRYWGDINVIKFINIVIIIIFAFSIIYSLIFEMDKFSYIFTSLFKEEKDVSQYALFSFLGHKNIYAMLIMLTISGSIISYSIFRKKFYLYFAIFPLIYLLLTFSKSAIIITYFLLICWFYFYSFKTINDSNKKRRIILISIISSIIVLLGILFIILFFNNEKIYALITGIFSEHETISSRIDVWQTIIELLSFKWLFTGRGYGTCIAILNDISHYDFGEYIAHEHSWIFSMLSKGGIILLSAFILLLILIGKTLYRCYKEDPIIASVFIVSSLFFFIQSFIENSYYMIFIIFVEANFYLASNNINPNKLFKLE